MNKNALFFKIISVAMGGILMTDLNASTFFLTCNAIQVNQKINEKFTCDGNDISPELEWSGAPYKTQSFVLIMDDPDAPDKTWDHWILFNIPKDATQLEENIKNLPNGTKVGKNSWGKTQYGGPCPPSGEHRYIFKFYALDCLLDLPEGASKQEIEHAMKGHILAQTEVVGRYQKSG